MLILCLTLAALAGSDRDDSPKVVLDGIELTVRWSDGDTFTWKDAGGNTQRARLSGYNTLESFGPVHRWGDWTGKELYDLAKAAGALARTKTWRCTKLPGSGGYGRSLVDCPDLRRALVDSGLAHLYSLDAPHAESELSIQRSAMERRRGLWEKGTTPVILTSLHSKAEGGEKTYDRVCSLTTGICEARPHENTYATCQEVCDEGSCMTYVPYEERYGRERASCLWINK
ncbi:MAG: micrococcal nuclease [Myxococcota bacterium]